MRYREIYDEWINNEFFNEAKDELVNIDDEDEIKNRFSKNLEFGTAGIRGKIGAGINRMNKFTVMLATEALAETIIARGGADAKERGVVIGYDSRKYSDSFAKISASVLANKGIKVYLYDYLRPTPTVSYAILNLRCYAGIMITASHNPKEYNGYKVYWKEGSQILTDIASEISMHLKDIKSVEDVGLMSEKEAIQKGLLKILGKEMDEKYLKDVLKLSLVDDVDKKLNIVYTPLHGTGTILVKEVLRRRGFENVFVVEDQEKPDSNFSTVSYPNPEDSKVFELAEKLGEKYHADILVATDPDCDRMACEIKDSNGDYKALTGNEVGAILIKYILDRRKEKNSISDNAVIVKTIVSGELPAKIAESFNVDVLEVLTGFKYICQSKNGYDEESKYDFLFGYEESIGYVYSKIVRDKDAVIATMLICEAAAYYKKYSKSLLDVLRHLYEIYGWYEEDLFSLKLDDKNGEDKIRCIMDKFRDSETHSDINDLKYFIDYNVSKKYPLKGGSISEVKLPKTNAVKYIFEDGSWFAVRPSGTEPKMKFYLGCSSDDKKTAKKRIKQLKDYVLGVTKQIL